MERSNLEIDENLDFFFWKAKTLKSGKIFNSGFWKAKIFKLADILNSRFFKTKS